MEFPCGAAGSRVVTVVTQVAAVVQLQFLAQELPRAVGMAKKKKRKNNNFLKQSLLVTSDSL